MINNPIINYIMELFKLHVFSAFLVAIVFYIVKILLKRMYKDETIENKKILKDSVLIFLHYLFSNDFKRQFNHIR